MKGKANLVAPFVLPRVQDVVFVCIFCAALLGGTEMLNTDGDLGRHLTLGRNMLSTLQIPTRDLLSHTLTGQARPPYEWLSQLVFAGTNGIFGLDGVVLLTALVLAFTFLVTYRQAVRRSAAPLLALVFTLWAAAASSLHWLTRPHIFSFLLLTIWIERLESLRMDRGTPLWHFPAIMLIWANTHGGFVFGLLAWLAYFAGTIWQRLRNTPEAEALKRTFLAGAASIAATVLTPDTWHNWEALLANRSRFVLSRTVETMPPDLLSPAIRPFTALLAAAILLLFLNRRGVAVQHGTLLAGLAAMALLMARNIPLFALAAAPILTTWSSKAAGSLHPWARFEAGMAAIDARLKGSVWPLISVTAAAGLLLFHDLNTGRPVYEFSPAIFPVAAADWISVHPPDGEMFNDFNWGGYLLYRLWPGQLVFVDSQSDFYGEPFLRQYESIMFGGPGWDSRLESYRVDWIIVPPGSGLAAAARGSTAWQVVYQDGVAIIFIRR
jgi:hypothetical protein